MYINVHAKRDTYDNYRCFHYMMLSIVVISNKKCITILNFGKYNNYAGRNPICKFEHIFRRYKQNPV